MCHSLAANPFIRRLRTHGSEQKQQPGRSQSRGQALGLSASLFDWHWDFWHVSLLSLPVKWGWQVLRAGVWEASGMFGKCCQPWGSRVETLHLRPYAIAFSCQNSKQALRQSEGVMCYSLGLVAASSSGCSAMRPSTEQDCGHEYGACRARSSV